MGSVGLGSRIERGPTARALEITHMRNNLCRWLVADKEVGSRCKRVQR
jgi:hypothetical protein